MKAKLISMTQNPLELLCKAAGECYQKEASLKVIKKIIESGHLSVLEHCCASFEVEASILVLLQMERHRHLSFTVQSSRGSELTSYHETGNPTIDYIVKYIMTTYHNYVEDEYDKKENLAYMLPKAANYKFIVTGNFRAWFEYLPKRLCKRASKEHRELAHIIYAELVKACPEVFGHVKPPCNTCKESGCTF